MLTITPARVDDIHELNREFLALVAAASSGDEFGLPPEVFEEIQSMSDAERDRVAATDILIFQISLFDDAKSLDHQGVQALVERAQFVIRDFARADLSLAVGHLNVTKRFAHSILDKGLMELRQGASQSAVRSLPLPVGVFRRLSQIQSGAERMQYVSVASLR